MSSAPSERDGGIFKSWDGGELSPSVVTANWLYPKEKSAFFCLQDRRAIDSLEHDPSPSQVLFLLETRRWMGVILDGCVSKGVTPRSLERMSTVVNLARGFKKGLFYISKQQRKNIQWQVF